jgi:hypothetical protein
LDSCLLLEELCNPYFHIKINAELLEWFELDLDYNHLLDFVLEWSFKGQKLYHMRSLCHAHEKASTCVYCNGERDLALHFWGVLDLDCILWPIPIISCSQTPIWNLHTSHPTYFKHAMPFFNKGEWPFLSSLLMQSSSTWMWRTQIGLVGLQCPKQHIPFTLPIWKPWPFAIPSWVGKDTWFVWHQWLNHKLMF